MNSVIMQFFEWYLPADSQHWTRLSQSAHHLSSLGINMVWMPPAFKGTNVHDVGYGVYDLYDLGEFDQHGTIPTKYGTKEQYLHAIQSLKAVGIKPIADIVLNHKANGDQKETFTVTEMNPNNRQEPISEPFEIDGWTHFSFPGRHKVYSNFEWHWYHFTGTDYNARQNKTGIYMIMGDNKGWAHDTVVDNENGNYDYLMFTDLDFKHPEVRSHLEEWVRWFIKETGVEGFRLDAVKHIDSVFMTNFIRLVRSEFGSDFYVFGEYWQADLSKKEHYLENIESEFDLIDVGLHMNFFQASLQEADYDLRTLFDNCLITHHPLEAVTFVDNHDTQRGQALESTVQDWFKPLAYAIILLRESGLPCIFYGDYFGIHHPKFFQDHFKETLDFLLSLRQTHAWGSEVLYLEKFNCIGWVRLGNNEHPNPLAVILSNHENENIRMKVGKDFAGKIFYDATGNCDNLVTIDENGYGDFLVMGRSFSTWIPQ